MPCASAFLFSFSLRVAQTKRVIIIIFLFYHIYSREHLIVLLAAVAAQSTRARAAWNEKRVEVAAVVWSLSRCRAISMARSLASLLASARLWLRALLLSAVARPANLLDELFVSPEPNQFIVRCAREERHWSEHSTRRMFNCILSSTTMVVSIFASPSLMSLWRCSLGLVVELKLKWPIDAHCERGKRQFIWSIACTGMPSPHAWSIRHENRNQCGDGLMAIARLASTN